MGKPFDPLQGKYGNIGGKLGAIVCIDVVNLSFEKAGIFLEKELRECYKENPSAFVNRNWDVPKNPFFARRVKNLYEYCKEKGFLLDMKEGKLQPGDILFFGQRHTALVKSISEGGIYTVVEASPEKLFVCRAVKADIEARWGKPTAWARIPALTIQNQREGG